MSEHYQCPNCGKRTSLWEGVEVPGWRSIDDQLQPLVRGGYDREVDWHNAVKTWDVGCAECSWEGNHNQLEHVVLGIDGRPLPTVLRSQLTIEDAA